MKLLVARRASDAAQAMTDAGLFGPLLASAPDPARLRALTKIEGAARAIPCCASPRSCLDVPEDAERLSERLRLSNAERQRLARAANALIALHGAESAPPPDELRRLLFLHGREAATDASLLTWIRAPRPAMG